MPALFGRWLGKGIEKHLIFFAELHPVIQAVYEGVDMEQYYEEGLLARLKGEELSEENTHKFYYFIAPNYKYNEQTEDNLSVFTSEIVDCDAMILPISLESIPENEYLKREIWRR